MESMKFKDMPEGTKSATFALLCAIEEKETKSGSSYVRVTLSDGESKIDANLWNKTKEEVLQRTSEGDLLMVEVYPKTYQGILGYELKRYGPAPAELNKADFMVSAPIESEVMYNDILNMLSKCQDVTLKMLATRLYQNNKDIIMKASAAKAVHHNFYGGLLYHTLRMMRSAVVLCKVYPTVDAELLLVGAALHDIGKLVELDTDDLGNADYTVDGNLFGHALLGIEMINDAILELKEVAEMSNFVYDAPQKERVKMLKHMLAAHHGQLDWGAVTIPATPEAMMLHEIDMIDSRMMQFEDTYKDLEPGEMSDKVFGLGTCVYKPLQ